MSKMDDLTNVKTVTLSITEKCNLNCLYCYEHNKSERSMSLDVAREIIDREMNEDPEFQSVEIDFFGGEPFLEFDTIKKLTEFVKEKKYDRKHYLFATTNGTMVHGEIQDWLRENRSIFICGLSLDGNIDTQNHNRSNSFNLIDLDFFQSMYPEQSVKMTISQDRLSYLYDDVVFLHERGFKISNNLAYGIDWSDPSNISILEENLMRLIDYYLSNPKIEPCSLLGTGIDTLGYDNSNTVNKKWCGTGFNMRAYDVDGNKYPCQFFLPVSIGVDKAEQSHKIVFLKDIPNELLDDKCVECPIKELCPSCYGSNFAATGNIYSKDINLCKLTKVIIKARAYFNAERWNRGQLLNLDEVDEEALLRSILKINSSNIDLFM